MIVLQYWFDFYHTSTWINHRCTCIPSLLSLPPTFCLFPLDYYRAPVWVSWVIQPIPTGYLFTNINVYTSMLLSPFISHSASSSPPSSINLFSMSVSPLLLCGQILQYHLSCCRVWLFATPWTAAHQASLFITNSRSLLKLMSIKLVLLSDHLILYCPLLLLPSFFPSFRVFSNELAWDFSISTSPSNAHSGLISFSIDWFDLLAVQGTLKSLLQHHSSEASILIALPYLWSNSHIHSILLDSVKVKVVQSCSTLCDPWTVACQAPLSMEFSRQEYWSGYPFPSLGNLPNPGIKPRSPTLQADSFVCVTIWYLFFSFYGRSDEVGMMLGLDGFNIWSVVFGENWVANYI